ncbi:DET1 [Acanthosepion pharaonis]|uniref:DET1 n=1 Tax=Acanthosepion pharaonis TaxID=158019 RepID=A0A812DIF7_ACAPH|nr:DET1 [Sepia pharaonis]
MSDTYYAWINDEIKPRKIPNQNVVHRIFTRQINMGRPGVQFNQSRMFYTNIFPNFTIVNVEKPPCFLRKFSPDGRYFIAFSAAQTSLEIYEFNGPAAAADLLKHFSGEHTSSGYDPQLSYLHSKLFDRFFTQKQVTVVAANHEQLNRECSLFTDDSKYVIVGSAIHVPEDPSPLFFEIYRNNESVPPNPRLPLEDYSLHIVELETGLLCDTRQFKCDKIFLSHNQGLYLYKDTLAVLSVQQQTIHIFQITKDGQFVDVRCVGRFCFDDDETILRLGLDPASNCHQIRPMAEKTINSLKHRLLVFLYARAKRTNCIYDEKWVSMMERPKACGDHPIRFYARDSGLLKFKIYAGLQGRNPPPTARRLVAFTFHPYEPFAISIQRTNAEYVVNFHVRHVTYEAD